MTKKLSRFLVLILLVVMMGALAACTINTGKDNPFVNKDNPGAIGDFNRDQAIDLTTSSIKNLKKHLDSESVSETGYFVQFDMDFDADDGTHFTLKFKANLFTFPYYKLDENGDVIMDEEGKPVVDEEKLKIHNEVIKKNDLIIEWFDGHTNRLLIGLYFDGKNSSLSNPGNNLYVNLRGETRRMFKNFGDTVAYQQLIRLITSIDIDSLLADVDGSADVLGDYLRIAVTNNYKVTKNGERTSIYYDAINFDTIRKDITDAVHNIFAPFGNKIDPLTNYYLGFKFSTLGTADIRSLTSNLRFLSEPEQSSNSEILCGAEINANGSALVKGTIVPFRTDMSFSYSARVQSNIKVGEYIDITEYKEFLHGQYEYKGELYVPMMEQNGMDSRMDAVVRTKLTDDVDKNDENRIQMSFTDKANGSRLLLGAYYCNERTYLNTTGLQDLYGGIKLSEIGFPRAFIDGPNVAQLLNDFYKMINQAITDYVDGMITGTGSSVLFNAIMDKMTSGEETISIRIDLELIKIVLRETQEGNPDYSTQDIIDLLSDSMGYNLEEIAFMLGITDAKRMLEKTWFDLTYNVVSSAIRIEMSSNATNENVNSLLFRLDLNPVKIGEEVAFPEGFDTWFNEYTELKEVKTISASVQGDVKFSNSAAVDISDLLGAMVGDKSGINTKYLLPASSSLSFTLVFDQYVKFDEYGGDVYPGDDWENQVGQMRGRIGFKLQVWENLANGNKKPLLNIYAKDVAFNTQCEEDKLGYVWVDIQATGFTKVKIREDVFLASLTDYMGGNSAAGEAMALSIPQIIGALISDANSLTFLPDAIELATSNKTIQKLFGVKAVLLSARLDIGLTPRVTGIAQLESEFADYTVGDLEDMTGELNFSKGVYEKNLYETIAVTFSRGGKTWIENLRVPYFRVPEPGDITDYETKEEYEAAVAKYEEYKVSTHSLIVVNGKTKYYPSTDGNFMGAFRSYTVEIRPSGGGGLASITAKVLGLVNNNLIWEPLEAKPGTINCTINNGSVTTPADFSLDFTKVTIDGAVKALYTVTVGPHSIGEVTYQVYITVRNRRIMKEAAGGGEAVQSELTTVMTAETGAQQASVAAEVSLDPYDYILWRGAYTNNYGEPENPIGKYLASRQDKKTVTFLFGDGIRESVTRTWFFDVGDGALNKEQFINSTGGNSLYAHTYFFNQLVALKIKVLPKVLKYIKFDGETANNTYTIDVLNTSTKTIDRFPTLYFEDGTSLRFTFALTWAYPVADNVTLKGSGLIEGIESPFLGHVGKQDFSWLSISKQYNGVGSWFNDLLLTINVEAPAKDIVGTYQVKNPIINAGGGTADGTCYAQNILVDGAEIRGYWIIDPLKPNSNYIPAALTAFFSDGTNKKYGTDTITWDTTSGLIVFENNKYRFTQSAVETAKTYSVKGKISQEFQFTLIVVMLPQFNALVDNIEYFDANGEVFDQNKISKDIGMDSSGATYKYQLNPFDALFMPTKFKIAFDENRRIILTDMAGVSTEFKMNYLVKPEIYGGGVANQYQYVIQVPNFRFVVYLVLNPTIKKAEVMSIALSEIDMVLNSTQIANGFALPDFVLNKEGIVTVGGESTKMKLSDYILKIFADVKVTMNSGEEKVLTPKILNFEKFDVQDTLRQQGTVLTVAFSDIAGFLDLNATAIATGVETIKTRPDFEIKIEPFTSDGKEQHFEGFALYSQEYSIEYSNGTVVQFSADQWRVSQTINMAINLLPIGTDISVVSRDVILSARENASADMEIILYAFLPDSSRVNLTVRIAPLEVQAFVSAENETFPITVQKNAAGQNYSVAIVNNMYALREYLMSADVLLGALPTTVRIGGTELNGVVWVKTAKLAENLANLNYNKTTEFKLATARVEIGKGIVLELYIRFLPVVLTSLVPDGMEPSPQGIEFHNLENNAITIRVNPYQTKEGEKRFAFSSNYTAKFGGSTKYSFKFNVFYGEVMFGMQEILYDFNGNTYSATYQAGDDKCKMTFRMDAGFGQIITVNLLFADQTVGMLGAEGSRFSDIGFGTADGNGFYDIENIDNSKLPSEFIIDPYGLKYTIPLPLVKDEKPMFAKMFIPNLIRINSSLSDTEYKYRMANVNVIWNSYKLAYNGKDQASDAGVRVEKMLLEGKIIREGFSTQVIQIYITGLDRSATQDNVQFESYESRDGNIKISTPQIGYPQIQIRNPFIFRYKKDMPKKIYQVKYNSGITAEGIPIYWEMTDKDVDYSGNNLTDKIVKYRLYDEKGQLFSFHIRSDKWEYLSLERMVGEKWQEMNPIYFLISSISGQSDIASFRIQFKVTDALGGGIRNGSQIFLSETSIEAKGSLAPILYFDQDAIALARQNGQDTPGVFRLGAEGKLQYEIAKSMATASYSSAKPSITESYFKYTVLNTTYNSSYVLIDPLNPVWPKTMQARVNWTTEPVTLDISDRGLPFDIDLIVQLNRGGGVIVGRSIYVKYIYGEQQTVIEFMHKINILFLDRSPISQVSVPIGTEPPKSVTLVTKDTYNRNTYANTYNPYSDSYDAVINSLNSAARIYGNSQEIANIVWNKDLKNSISFSYMGKTFGSETAPCSLLKYMTQGA